jgi:hypothetical protein
LIIFVQGEKEEASFNLFACGCPVFIAPFLEKAPFFSVHVFDAFVGNQVAIPAWPYF